MHDEVDKPEIDLIDLIDPTDLIEFIELIKKVRSDNKMPMNKRRIVLLADGTGNSAAKISKTNIWRIYQSINAGGDDQLAFYDDGVGASGIRIMRLLGGVFGFGLARNVRQLYECLCRHYHDENDQILLFGFSRGAFTVRVLSSMIHYCGVIDRNSGETVKVWCWKKWRCKDVGVDTDEGLKVAVRIAYRALRKLNSRARLANMFRRLRGITFGRFFTEAPDTEYFCCKYSVSPAPRIAFLGVFDTVSAYGMPMDEIAIFVHKCLFPLRFPDMTLLGQVDYACQALAIDEARKTFHPMLWTECPSNCADRKNYASRLQQVWFPGVHSDIGGGYGDAHLSLVPLLWLMSEAQEHTGLNIRATDLEDWTERAAALGTLHDSRRGFASFYRYKPRLLDELGCEDMDGNGYVEVRIDRFKIHESVFERIRETGADYAPLGIPVDYDVVRKTNNEQDAVYGTVTAADAGHETNDERIQRGKLQARLRPLITWRRRMYYLMTGIVLVLVAVPLFMLPDPAAIPCCGWMSSVVGAVATLLDYLPIPKGDRIGRFWTQNAEWFLSLVGIYAVAFVFLRYLVSATQARAQAAWFHIANRDRHGSD